MPHIPQDDIATRKREHLDLALNEAVRTHDAGFEAITLPYDALFEVSDSALDTHTSMAGHELSFPLMIGAMTGGSPYSTQINTDLRALTRELGIALCLGSIRAYLADNTCRSTYGADLGGIAFANIGIAELTTYSPQAIEEACLALGTKGIFVHLNYLQEAIQHGGNRKSGNGFAVLESFCRHFSLPVFVKEVGSGIGGACAKRLAELPIAGIETAGRGGTSWVLVEALRHNPPLPKECIEALKDVGYHTPDCIRAVRQALPTRYVIASGGIETPLDAIKALAIGAEAVAIAQPILRTYTDTGRSGLTHWLSQFIETSRLIWRSTGARHIDELKKN